MCAIGERVCVCVGVWVCVCECLRVGVLSYNSISFVFDYFMSLYFTYASNKKLHYFIVIQYITIRFVNEPDSD